MNEKNTILSR